MAVKTTTKPNAKAGTPRRHEQRVALNIKAMKQDARAARQAEKKYTDKEMWFVAAFAALLMLNLCMFAWR